MDSVEDDIRQIREKTASLERANRWLIFVCVILCVGLVFTANAATKNASVLDSRVDRIQESLDNLIVNKHGETALITDNFAVYGPDGEVRFRVTEEMTLLGRDSIMVASYEGRDIFTVGPGVDLDHRIISLFGDDGDSMIRLGVGADSAVIVGTPNRDGMLGFGLIWESDAGGILSLFDADGKEAKSYFGP